jgi:acetylornithine deacetylase/succinyl-diaminopimelate desuccinylase-like protein
VAVKTDGLRAYLEAHRERHVERISAFLRQPTLPSEGRGVGETLDLFAATLRELGCQEVELVPTAGEPGVFGFYDAGAPVTIVSYCMLDTKSPAGRWSVPPFEARRTRVAPHGEVLLGVGARSRKGPYVSWLNAVEALIAVDGTLPVNVIFLAEGEENLGSPHYAAMVERYRERITRASACFSPGAAEAGGVMTVRLGYKGLLVVRLRASGAEWGRGPAGRNAHGMSQVLVDSPSWRLVAALASLVDDDGRRVAVPGFYDQLVPPSDDERAEVRALVAANRGRRWQDVLGGVGGDVGASSAELSDDEAYERYFYEPSFNLHGLAAGYTSCESTRGCRRREARAAADRQRRASTRATSSTITSSRTTSAPSLGCGRSSASKVTRVEASRWTTSPSKRAVPLHVTRLTTPRTVRSPTMVISTRPSVGMGRGSPPICTGANVTQRCSSVCSDSRRTTASRAA